MSRLWEKLKRFYHETGSPKYFYQLTSRLLPWFTLIALVCLTTGVIWGLFFAPKDYQQGDSFRIIYIHVPCASLALSIYFFMALAAAVSLVWKMKMADILAASCAPVGALFTFVALVTGALWGKPTWGTWWVWDARLTSMLILLFLYMGLIALRSSMSSLSAASRASNILAIVGVVNLPIIKYSVEWWNTLHQPATFKLTEKPAMPPEMWIPLLIMVIGSYAYFGVILMMRARTEILSREYKSQWVKETIGTKGGQNE